MNQCASIRLISQALLFSGVVLVAGNGTSYAADADDVKAAIAAYHGALTDLDATKMGELWAHDDTVMDIEPTDKAISLGWDAVKKNLETEFANLAELKLMQADGPHIQVKGDVAWSTGMANATTLHPKGGPVLSNVLTYETDVFQKRDGKWLLVSHTALRVPQ
jgi:ketosteroid isomerase-like protein